MERNMTTAESLPLRAPSPNALPLGAATGGVRLLLRLVGGAMLAAAIAAYDFLGGEWWMFFLLLLVPDLSIAGYLFGRRSGAFAYNAMHSYLGPALLAGLAWLFYSSPQPFLVAAIWVAHIGLDRLLGFGLKYAAGFKFTHLGVLGSAQMARDQSEKE
jgi:hypothetical protein